MEGKQVIDIAKLVGKGYGEFWKFKGRYVVVKGSRASKKSKTTALWHIYNIMKYPGSNALVVRKTERTMRDSVYSDLLWAIDRLKVTEFWRGTTNPLELTYVPTGQKILFRGFDDSLKITSISVPKGVLSFVWVEECYEISKEEDFDMLDESIRGSVEDYPGLFKRLTLTMNPWSDKHWVRRRFFDTPNTENKLAMTTTWRCNEWLDENDKRIFEEMKIRNPRRWRVASEGDWGVIDGLIYDNWIEKEFDHREVSKRSTVKPVFGLDFGYTNDPSALFCGLIDPEQKEIYVFDEMYEKAMTNPKIAEEIIRMGYAKEKITADCAEPKSIEELYNLGLRRIVRSRKGKDSIRAGINYIQNYKIIIHPRCVNFLTEISNYIWEEDKFGNKTNKPIDDFNHCLVAGTMVETLDGAKPIEEVTTEDYVLTRQGYKKVAWSGISDRNRTVYRVTTDTGHEIIGTNNHKILTQDGFCDIDSLRYGDNVLIRKWSKSSKHTEKNGDEQADLMTLFATANAVEKSSQSTDTLTRDFAVGRVLSVEELPEKADVVYDLTITDCHEFFANGILVHNCMDAMRYALEDYSRGSLVGFN